MGKSFIYLQASLKFCAVLNCYEAEKAKGRDVFVLLPYYLRNTKMFIDELHLNARTLILEKFIGKHLVLYSFIYKRRIKKYLSRLGIDDNTHFYFTDVNDDHIGFLLPFLSKCNPTQILMKQDILDGPNYQIGIKTSNLRKKMYAKLLSMLYSTHFIAVEESGLDFLYTDNKAFCLPVIDYSDTSNISKYKIKVTDSSNSVLFYTSPYINTLYEKDEYDKLNKEIVYSLHKKGYRVYLKNHPVLGGPDVAPNLADEIIPSYIPGEYIELSSFNFAIGFFSATIATAGEIIPSYSVLNVGGVKNPFIRDKCIEYLKSINTNIVFLNSLEEIPSFV